MEIERTVDSENIFKGNRLQVEKRTIEVSGQQSTREIVHTDDAVTVLAIDTDDKVFLVKQYRAAVDDFVLEIPAGKIDSRDSTNPRSAIIRELNEEIRMTSDSIDLISQYWVSVGWADEKLYFYVAQNLKPVENTLPRDETENLEIIKVSFEEMEELFNQGKLMDSKTQLAYWWWKSNR